MADDSHHYRAPEPDSVASPTDLPAPPPPASVLPDGVPLVSVHRADNGDLVIIINRQASAIDLMLAILRSMGAS